MEERRDAEPGSTSGDAASSRFTGDGRVLGEGSSVGGNMPTVGPLRSTISATAAGPASSSSRRSTTAGEDSSLGLIPGIGRRLRVFLQAAARPATASSSRSSEVHSVDDLPDEAYEFTAEDYARVMAGKKPEEIHLKTQKIRDREKAEKLKHLKKVVIRVQFPDALVVEAIFDPEERVSDVKDLVQNCIAHPDVSFHLYTTPPKQIFKDFSKTVYQAGLAPGATIFFAHVPPQGATPDARAALTRGPFLRPEVLALSEVDIPPPSAEMLAREVSVVEPMNVGTSSTRPSTSDGGTASGSGSSSKRPGKQPKWFKR